MERDIQASAVGNVSNWTGCADPVRMQESGGDPSGHWSGHHEGASVPAVTVPGGGSVTVRVS